jgi:predicted short-subunit dehydrogenase-like oxidoreductase (DUF2520 family)
MRIVLVGTGNLATRLGLALQAKNAGIIQVFGRTETEASRLAGLIGCSFTVSKTHVSTDADIYILAVSDDAIPEVAASIPTGDHFLVHTAGSVSLEMLSAFSANCGVLYPLQTLSRQRAVDFSKIPVCIEANNGENLRQLHEIAGTISDQVINIDSVQRMQLHLAAVFVCNFVNHFYSIGAELLKEHHLNFDLLKPVILETANKAMQFSPHAVQTGPAVRGNKTVMERHLQMLERHPEWQKMYELISKDISNLTMDNGQRTSV